MLHIALAISLALAAQEPTTLIVRGPDGAFLPGAARSWQQTEAGIRLTVDANVDLEAVLAKLALRLPAVRVAVEARTIELTGVAAKALLEQLAIVRLGDSHWGDLSDLRTEASPGMKHPSAGGSIRASFENREGWGASDVPTRGSVIAADTDESQQFSARVLSAARGEFPRVLLRLEVIEPAADAPAHAKGDQISAEVSFVRTGAEIDLVATATRRNLGAYFLVAGDEVRAHTTGTKRAWTVDYVARTAVAKQDGGGSR